VGRGGSATILLADLLLGIRELTYRNSLDDIVGKKYWHLLQQHKHFKFTIIEEKKKDLSPKELKDCEPQVMAKLWHCTLCCLSIVPLSNFDRQTKAQYVHVISNEFCDLMPLQTG